VPFVRRLPSAARLRPRAISSGDLRKMPGGRSMAFEVSPTVRTQDCPRLAELRRRRRAASVIAAGRHAGVESRPGGVSASLEQRAQWRACPDPVQRKCRQRWRGACGARTPYGAPGLSRLSRTGASYRMDRVRRRSGPTATASPRRHHVIERLPRSEPCQHAPSSPALRGAAHGDSRQRHGSDELDDRHGRALGRADRAATAAEVPRGQITSSCSGPGSVGNGAWGSVWYQKAVDAMSSCSGR
jgi:hypothetical protein